MSRLQKQLLVTTIVLILFFMNQPYQTMGLTSNSNLTIIVNVTDKTIVDIQPKALSWVGIEPGAEGNQTREGINSVTIENMGSTNITKIWFYNSYPPTRPFGTADVNAYDPGNFVVITNSSYVTGGSNNLPYYFINRVEYPEPYHSFVILPPSCVGTYCFMSRFRNASKEYFFIVDNSSTGRCDGTAQIRIASNPRVVQSTTTETIDLSAEPPITLTHIGVIASGPWAGNWSAAEVTVNGTDTYCVAVTTNCSMAVFSRFNADVPGIISSACTNVPAYWVNGTTLVPGEWREAGIRVRVPYGTVAGQLPPGTLTVYVSDT